MPLEFTRWKAFAERLKKVEAELAARPLVTVDWLIGLFGGAQPSVVLKLLQLLDKALRPRRIALSFVAISGFQAAREKIELLFQDSRTK